VLKQLIDGLLNKSMLWCTCTQHTHWIRAVRLTIYH